MSKSDLLSKLNPAQQEAVEYMGGPLLILAGAGTGKTRTITRRIAHLVKHQNILPSRILAITFTNKAAQEMRNRITAFVPSTGMWVGTFHAVCARILRMEPESVGRTKNFTIIDVEDRRKLLRKLIKKSGLDPQVYRPRRFESLISNWKQNCLAPSDLNSEPIYSREEELCAKVYNQYEASLLMQDSLDFDDLLWKGVQVLKQDQGRQTPVWINRFDHVLVDEYQDTNQVQFDMVSMLSKKTRNLAVCGDPDQSIYRWRGADISNILNFERDFEGAKIVRLEQNYRSAGNILKAAQHVIAHNVNRYPKGLFTTSGDGEPILLNDAYDEQKEADMVAMQVARWIDAGKPSSELAVFYRTNACSRSLEQAFTRLQIPYQLVGGVSFFERREIKDLLAFARLIINPRDDVAFERVINVPTRGIGAGSVDKIRLAADKRNEPMLTTIKREEVRDAIRGPGKKGLLKFLSIYNNIRKNTECAELALRDVVERTGYRRYVDKLEASEDVDRLANIDELLAFAAEYDNREEGGIAGFLQEISLLTDTQRWDTNAEKVSLMTVHSAKGLEFDCVAVIGNEEGLFPHSRSFEEVDGLEEERRLFYVAITRARLELMLTYANVRYRTGAPGPTAPSRFLQEIPNDVLPASKISEELCDVDSVSIGSLEGANVSEKEELKVGDEVSHPVFGDGCVERIQGHGANARIVVEFYENQEQRTLLMAYSMLDKIE
jgi:DNA helicase-2/ATP-dependent DNA helicase PcrA